MPFVYTLKKIKEEIKNEESIVFFCEYNEDVNFVLNSKDMVVGEFFDTRSNRQPKFGRREKDRCKEMWKKKQEDPYDVCANRVAKTIMKNKRIKEKAEKKSWVKNMCKLD
jgi:hypothetical protein